LPARAVPDARRRASAFVVASICDAMLALSISDASGLSQA
jgi:hypothetical protein